VGLVHVSAQAFELWNKHKILLMNGELLVFLLLTLLLLLLYFHYLYSQISKGNVSYWSAIATTVAYYFLLKGRVHGSAHVHLSNFFFRFISNYIG